MLGRAAAFKTGDGRASFISPGGTARGDRRAQEIACSTGREGKIPFIRPGAARTAPGAARWPLVRDRTRQRDSAGDCDAVGSRSAPPSPISRLHSAMARWQAAGRHSQNLLRIFPGRSSTLPRLRRPDACAMHLPPFPAVWLQTAAERQAWDAAAIPVQGSPARHESHYRTSGWSFFVAPAHGRPDRPLSLLATPKYDISYRRDGERAVCCAKARPTMLEIVDVVHHYGSVLALDHVSVSAAPG